MNHAGKRAFTRYGVEMPVEDQWKIAAEIGAGNGKRLARVTRGEVWAVYWPRIERTIPVVYLREAHCIATVLPAVCLRRTTRYHELDVDWIDEDADDAFDADALADVLVDTLRAAVPNDVLAVRLKEAGVAQ